MAHGPPTCKKSNPDAEENREKNMNDVDAMPVPPDGGWGWMVVFGSLMIHIITDGMTYSFGLFYDEFLTYFNEGKGYTAWIASIMVGVTFASGPIASSFVNRYGCRAVTIAGSILAAICIMASMFAQNVLTLIFTIGLGTGLGFGLIYLPAIVSVTTYFEARRSLATGIAVCGSGFGTFLFAPLTQHLIKEYGWRGALLIIGAIVLNCIIFGAMFRPLEPPKATKSKKSIAAIDNNATNEESIPLKSSSRLELPAPPLSETEMGTAGEALRRSNSVGLAYKKNQNKTNGVVNGRQKTTSVSNGGSTHDMRVYSSHPHLASGSMYRKDALYQGSTNNLPEYTRSRTDLHGSGVIQRYGSFRYSESEKCCGCVSCSQETRDTFAEMMNFSLLRDVIFIIFAISNFCTSIGLNMPYVYIVAKAKTLDLDGTQSSYLIGIIGIANTVGRIVLGYVSDKPWVNRLWVYNVCLVVCGIACTMVPFCTGFYSLAFFCKVFGFSIGAYVGLTSVILVDLLGLEKLTNAFGLLLLFQGVASFIGPPIGGWMFDITGSYDPAFVIAGVMIAISGLVMFIVPPLQRRNARKAAEANGQQQIAMS